jgi:hypothetical protein
MLYYSSDIFLSFFLAALATINHLQNNASRMDGILHMVPAIFGSSRGFKNTLATSG